MTETYHLILTPLPHRRFDFKDAINSVKSLYRSMKIYTKKEQSKVYEFCRKMHRGCLTFPEEINGRIFEPFCCDPLGPPYLGLLEVPEGNMSAVKDRLEAHSIYPILIWKEETIEPLKNPKLIDEWLGTSKPEN